VTQVLQEHFKPEFLNRIDDIVIFHRLSRDQISQIVDVQLERLRQTLRERNISIVLDDSAKEMLAREGYDPSFGARPLKRAIQTLIQNPLAMKLLRGEIQPGQTVTVSARNGEMVFASEKVAAAA
jgi:ATP-dependent Clp protease ATP-binding subunit ClpB